MEESTEDFFSRTYDYVKRELDAHRASLPLKRVGQGLFVAVQSEEDVSQRIYDYFRAELDKHLEGMTEPQRARAWQMIDAVLDQKSEAWKIEEAEALRRASFGNGTDV